MQRGQYLPEELSEVMKAIFFTNSKPDTNSYHGKLAFMAAMHLWVDLRKEKAPFLYIVTCNYPCIILTIVIALACRLPLRLALGWVTGE